MAEAAGKYARWELERRYLLAHIPEEVDRAAGSLIVDRYIDGTRLRLRRVEPLGGGEPIYKLGQKQAPDPADFSRTTITNMYLSADEYRVLGELPGCELRKRRHRLQQYSIDVFDGHLSGLVLAEISCDTQAELEAHPAPSFALREVSREVRFTGAALAAAPAPPA